MSTVNLTETMEVVSNAEILISWIIIEDVRSKKTDAYIQTTDAHIAFLLSSLTKKLPLVVLIFVTKLTKQVV